MRMHMCMVRAHTTCVVTTVSDSSYEWMVCGVCVCVECVKWFIGRDMPHIVDITCVDYTCVCHVNQLCGVMCGVCIQCVYIVCVVVV